MDEFEAWKTDDLATANEQIERYYRYADLMRDNPYQNIHLAEIKKIEVDDEGKPTGRATVNLLSMPGVRTSVLIPIPSSQYWFAGGLPPINTLCSVGFLPQLIGVILNYYPFKLDKLRTVKALPDLTPGEIYLRAQYLENNRSEPGATVTLDRTGRVEIKDRTGNSVIELKPNGEVLVTAQKVKVLAAEVVLGDESAEELATKTFVQQVYDQHTHPDPTSGTTGPPTLTSSTQPASFTSKTKAK